MKREPLGGGLPQGPCPIKTFGGAVAERDAEPLTCHRYKSREAARAGVRPELVATGAALLIFGMLLLSMPLVVPSSTSYEFGPFSWTETGASTSYSNPFGLLFVVTGLALLILGFVLQRPQPVGPAGGSYVYYVPAPQAPPAPPPAHAPLASPAPPPQARAPVETTAPRSFATPLRGTTTGARASPAPAPPALATAAPAASPAPAPAPASGPAPAPPTGPAPAPTPAVTDALVAGACILDKFEVQRGLGQGTFGGTYLARDLLLDRSVVLKELLPQWRDDADATSRFVKEAKIVANLRHPNIVDLYGVERWGSGLLLVMEYADGGSLAQLVRERGRLPEKDALKLADEVLAALEAVHARGILHRDVKPSNILLTREKSVRLADFGIAYAPSFGATVGERAPGTSHPGSLPFMAPEQVEGRELDARADLYAVGATLYYVVVGAPYVDLSGKTQESMRRAVLHDPPRLPVEGLSPELNAVLTKALAKRPQDRFASAAEMRKWLPEGSR